MTIIPFRKCCLHYSFPRSLCQQKNGFVTNLCNRTQKAALYTVSFVILHKLKCSSAEYNYMYIAELSSVKGLCARYSVKFMLKDAEL